MLVIDPNLVRQFRLSSSLQSSLTSSNLSKFTELDLNDPLALEIYSRVLLFKDDNLRDELSFARSLTSYQRRIVHLVAKKLGLEHSTRGEGEDRHIVVFKGGIINRLELKPRIEVVQNRVSVSKEISVSI